MTLPAPLQPIDISPTTWIAITPDIGLQILAAWESLIGIGLLPGRFLRLTLLLLFAQMPGTMLPVILLPLILFPAETFTAFPYAPTMEGQYIIKNLVLVAAAIVIGATVRGGRLRAEPDAPASSRLSTRAPHSIRAAG